MKIAEEALALSAESSMVRPPASG